jgi:phosphate starvation-inducible protein PhoH
MLYAEPSLKIAQIFCDDERLGFSPGDLTEKVNPYLRPFYDARHDMMTQQ